MHSKYSIIVSNGWDNHLILYIYHHLIFSQPRFLLSLVLLKCIIIDFVNETAQNGRYGTFTQSCQSFFYFISYLASPQIEMCHCRRKVEHKHKCSFIRKQKHTDKQEDDENSFSGEIKFKLKLMQMRTISCNLFYTVGVSCFIIIIFVLTLCCVSSPVCFLKSINVNVLTGSFSK